MNNPPVPPYMKAKHSRLPEGPDESLEPDVDPVDPETRSVPPSEWPATDTSPGPNGARDGRLAPPGVDPARRSVPASTWPTGRPRELSNRPLRELVVPVPDLDPDIAMWPANIISRWPFTGPPTEGIWPLGWMGVDNTATVYICSHGGEPGTWEAIGGAGLLAHWGVATTSQFVGSGSPVGVVTPSGTGDLYVDNVMPALWQATGTANTDWQPVISPVPSCSVFQSAGFSLGGGASFQHIGFDSIPTDNFGAYNGTTGLYTPPIAGRYSVIAAASFTLGTDGQFFTPGIFQTGVGVRTGPVATLASSSSGIYTGVATGILSCSTSDTIGFRILTASPITGQPGQSDTYMDIQFLGTF